MEETVNITSETNVKPPVVDKTTIDPKGVEKGLETGKTVATGVSVKTPDPVKKYKVKVDGKEEEVTEDELLRGYSHSSAANKKMQEAAKIRKESEEFIHRLKTDPMGLLEDPRLGIDARKSAEEYLLKKMEFDAMSPAEKENVEMKMKLAEAEAEKKAQEKTKQDAEAVELTKRYSDEYSKDIMEALKSSGLPQTEHTVRRMAYYMFQALQRNYELKAIDVIPLVRQDYINDSKSLFENLDGQVLEELLGEKVAEKIRAYGLTKIKTVGKKVATTEQGHKEGDNPLSKRISKEEWRKRLDAI